MHKVSFKHRNYNSLSPMSRFTLIELLVSKTCQICVSLLFLQKYLSNFATNWSKIIPLFLKEKGGAGERENFFSREKKFFPSSQERIHFDRIAGGHCNHHYPAGAEFLTFVSSFFLIIKYL